MNTLAEMKITQFLEELASSSPAPGGGSVAALSGALGAALSSMVCNLTIGKEKYKDVQEEIIELRKHSEQLRKKLTELIDKDTVAFTEVMTALKMPKETEEQKEKRKHALQKAYKIAAYVPLETGRTCSRILDVAKLVAEKGNKNSITDVAVSALMAKAGVEAAILNVRINLNSIQDSVFVDNISRELNELQQSTSKKTTEIIYLVEHSL